MIDGGYERYVEPYSYEVRDRRVRIARGLQAVDGLTTSAVFDEPAKRYVEGEFNAEALRDIVDAYYDQKVSRARDRYSEEADLVAARICALLEGNGFSMSTTTMQTIHAKLFQGLMEDPFYEHNFRDYNFTKREFVLARESVEYGEWTTLKEELDAALSNFQPPTFDPQNPLPYAKALSAFTAHIWQIHPFAEGNTRTTAIFIQKMLRNRGFAEITNAVFEENSLRFRNALVRACYSNDALGVQPDTTFLDTFMQCLLTNAPYPFRSRDMASEKLYASKGMLPPAAEHTRLG